MTDSGGRNQPGLDVETRPAGGREDTMKVLTVYAHQNPRSFCHGVLEHFTRGLRDAGHASEVIDLYAIGFDPVFRDRDVASYVADDVPADILDLMDLRAQVMNSCRGPVQRWAAARALRG
jgi:NAD(P)H dehydrogenase (quinone)